MPKILDRGREAEIAEGVVDVLVDGGETTEQAIPGLVQAILHLLVEFPLNKREQVIDEVIRLLEEDR